VASVKKKDMIEVTESSGNVFADLGLANAEELYAKGLLAIRIASEVKARGLTQVEAGKVLGVSQARVSNILRGNTDAFSLDRLLQLLTRMSCDVEIRVGRPKAASRPGKIRVRAA